jgi:hypothetical protein
VAYRVQIVEGGTASYELATRFATIELAEDAGYVEVTRLRDDGRRAFYNILDQDGRPIGPSGPPNIPEGYGVM